MGEAKRKRDAIANRPPMRWHRALVNWIVILSLPVWGGLFLLGAFL